MKTGAGDASTSPRGPDPGYDRAMMASRPTLALTLALLLALRAFVPVGYMIALPAGDGGRAALVLCPTQNRGLDLGVLESRAGIASHDHHAHHHPDPRSDSGTGPVAIEIGSECSAWLASAAAAPGAAPDGVAFPQRPAATPPSREAPRTDAAPRGHTRTRAPPTVV